MDNSPCLYNTLFGSSGFNRILLKPHKMEAMLHKKKKILITLLCDLIGCVKFIVNVHLNMFFLHCFHQNMIFFSLYISLLKLGKSTLVHTMLMFNLENWCSHKIINTKCFQQQGIALCLWKYICILKKQKINLKKEKKRNVANSYIGFFPSSYLFTQAHIQAETTPTKWLWLLVQMNIDLH